MKLILRSYISPLVAMLANLLLAYCVYLVARIAFMMENWAFFTGPVTFDFIKLEHFRGFVKAGASLDFLVNYTGSLHATELPYHAPIAKEQVEPIRFSCFGGIGGAFKVANRIELIPEIQYRMTNGSLYRADFPFDIRMTSVDFRLGLTYYF